MEVLFLAFISMNFPGGSVPNVVFNRNFGPSRNRQIVAPNPQGGNQNNWQIVNRQPLDEPGRFDERLSLRYPLQFMVPEWNPNVSIEGMYGQQRWQVLRDFTDRLHAEFMYRDVGQFRIYVARSANALNIVYPSSTQRYFDAEDLGWMTRVRRALALELINFVDNYEEMFEDRAMPVIQIYVDIELNNSGGAGRQLIPRTLKGFKELLWSPSGSKDCYIKCMRQHFNKDLTWLRIKFKDCPDHTHFEALFNVSCSVFPDTSFRLYSESGRLRFRKDAPEYTSNICFLILVDAHWLLITNIQQFVLEATGNKFFCRDCDWQLAELHGEHHCQDIQCERCGMKFTNPADKTLHQHRDSDEPIAECNFCLNRSYYSAGCVAHHKLFCRAREAQEQMEAERLDAAKTADNARKRRWKENNPDKVRESNRVYQEQFTNCLYCNKRVPMESFFDHVHWLERREEKEIKFERWFAFDYESMLVDRDDGSQLHVVNLVCVQELYARPILTWTFPNMRDFLAWIRAEIVPTGVNVAFVAHNLKGYDGRLTLGQIFQDHIEGFTDQYVTDMVWTMAKINTFTYCETVTFRDSLLHIPLPLAAWPSTFGMKGDTVEISKGFFPYIFNAPQFQDYVGPMPDIRYFQPELMTPSYRKKFMAWYNEHRNDTYNLQDELLKYCRADVDILARGLEIYNDAGKLLNGDEFPPLEQLTIASYTTHVWFCKFIPEQTLAYHNETCDRNARDALRGGRTDVRVFYRKYSLDDVFEKRKYMKYVDVQSMYPYVMYKYPYPAGGPKIIFNATPDDLRSKFGFACVDIQPPQVYRHHPALVHKYRDRLCATLKEWKKTVFTTVELLDALEQGWTITKIDWIQYYPQQTDTLFKDYIRKLVSEKIHSSKPPPESKHPELIRKWKHEFDLEFTPDKCEYNAGKRALSKLMLNSLWGKLSEKYKASFSLNVDATKFIEYENKEMLGEVEIRNRFRIGPNNWMISGDFASHRADGGDNFIEAKNRLEHRKKTCVSVGSFVTMYGRRMLYEQMKKLGDRVVYFDTDSIIYDYNENAEYNVVEGDVLGDWEVENDGLPIIEFVALAPKTYAYRYLDIPARKHVDDPTLDLDSLKGLYEVYKDYVYPVREECKVKGFKLHHEARQQINFEGLLELYRQQVVSLQAKQLQFLYNRENNEITTRTFNKQLIFEYEKGVIGAQDQSFPFGVENYWCSKTRYVREGAPRQPREHPE